MGISIKTTDMKIDEYEYIEELKRLKKLATQGEWISGYVSGKTTARPVISANRRIICKSPKVYRYGNQHLAACDADMAYIAAACNAVPDLIHCNENLRAQVELLNKVIDCLAQERMTNAYTKDAHDILRTNEHCDHYNGE